MIRLNLNVLRHVSVAAPSHSHSSQLTAHTGERTSTIFPSIDGHPIHVPSKQSVIPCRMLRYNFAQSICLTVVRSAS